ncbi:hypothetical protein DFJ63DRAFT_337134 [Scheffersomyces coipomensis]|uniref:uncharacterized protein n=1 Tax=Scheffersomyces coipomensis TaxID=1788519 RepID=UPI00315D71C7
MTQYSYVSDTLKEKQQESSYNGSDILATIGSIFVTIFVFLLRNSIILFKYGYTNYPEVTAVIILLVAVYIVYKLLSRIVRFWINLFITAVKIILVIMIIAVAFTIYLRGFQRLINHDLPLLAEFLSHNIHHLFTTDNNNLNNSFKNNSSSSSSTIASSFFNSLFEKVSGSKLFGKFVASKAKSFLDDFDNINVDEYVEYVQSNLKGGSKPGNSNGGSSGGGINYENLVNQGLDYLKKNDLNVEDIKDFFKNNI